eukprot:766513-Hanusia_phi.AAC.9
MQTSRHEGNHSFLLVRHHQRLREVPRAADAEGQEGVRLDLSEPWNGSLVPWNGVEERVPSIDLVNPHRLVSDPPAEAISRVDIQLRQAYHLHHVLRVIRSLHNQL